MTDDNKKLLDHCVDYATELLTETGHCYPFGAYADRIGVHPLEMEIDEKNVPQIGRVIEVLTTYCEKEIAEGKMKAYCLSYEVKVKLDETTTTDAIAFELRQSEENDLPKFFLPFSYQEDKSVILGELFAVK